MSTLRNIATRAVAAADRVASGKLVLTLAGAVVLLLLLLVL